MSLLIDGAKRIGNTYEAIILFTPYRLYFYPFAVIPRDTADFIAKVVANAINFLKTHNITVIAACTDNASTNRAAFGDHSYSIKYRIGHGIIRIPCYCHGGNNAIKDVFGPKGSMYSITQAINILLKTPPGNAKAAPYISSTRWNSIFLCVEYIIKHKDYYSTAAKTKNIFQTIESVVSWDVLFEILSIGWDLIRNLEGDHASICIVFKYVYEAYIKLEQFPNSQVAIALHNSIEKRFTQKESFFLAALAFLLSYYGYSEYRSLTSRSLLQNVSICAAKGAVQYAKERDYDENLVLEGLSTYLRGVSWSGFENDPMAFWLSMKRVQIPSFQTFASLAYEVIQIPCSEASVERFFSHLEKIISPERHKLSTGSISALSIVKMNYLFGEEMKPGCAFNLLEKKLTKAVNSMHSSSFYASSPLFLKIAKN